MHLLIDGQALQTSSSRQRGIGRYSSNFLRALAIARPNWRIEVVQNSNLKPIPADDLNGLPALSFHPPLRSIPEQHEVNERYYADWLTARGADAVLILSHCEGWDAIIPSFCGSRPRIFGIAYDFIPLMYPEHYLTELPIARWYAHRFRQLLQCDALMAISKATASDVRTLGGSEAPLVVNIGGAVDPRFVPLSPAELAGRAPAIRKRFGLHRAFILYLGTPDYRKNLHGAIRAFATLPSQWRTGLDLAVVCRMTPAQRASFEETAQQAGVASAMRFLASVDDEDLRLLYQMCRLFFFPSLYEGMGLPVLEALHCGAPVVTSNRSSLPEYAGPHSWRGDPTSPPALAKLLQQGLAEPRDIHRQDRLAFARTFTWQQTASLACATMERSMSRSSDSVRRRRLAWVTSLSGNTPDLVEQAIKSLPRLAERFDIELIAVGGASEAPEALARHFLILTPDEVRSRHAACPFDMFLYQWTAPSGHPVMLDLLMQFPGVVVPHNSSALHWINRTIEQSQQNDALWLGFAQRSLADCADPTDAVIDFWAALRARGQRQLAFRPSQDVTRDPVLSTS